MEENRDTGRFGSMSHWRRVLAVLWQLLAVEALGSGGGRGRSRIRWRRSAAVSGVRRCGAMRCTIDAEAMLQTERGGGFSGTTGTAD
jgi:hypothetical protein